MFFDGLQAHDNGKLYVGCWVAVAYNEGFFIGQVTSAQSAENILINFLMKSKNEMYKWPRRKDSDSVSTKYIFCSSPRVQKVGDAYVVTNGDAVKHIYETYKKKYM